jgi:flagellar basal-body rod protein FlgG
MEVSQRISVSGMLAAQRQLDVVSNNLANVGSASFKRARAQVTDVGYQAGITAPVGPGGADVRIIGVGEGVQVAGISHDFLPGAVQATGNPLDVALQGDGFFQVLLPSGQMGYTRDGALSIDAQGRLVTAGGLPVQSADGGDLVLPADVIGARFNEAGEVVAERTDGTGPVLVGRVGLAVFRNNQGLEAAGQNLFLETAASGPAALLHAECSAHGAWWRRRLECRRGRRVHPIDPGPAWLSAELARRSGMGRRGAHGERAEALVVSTFFLSIETPKGGRYFQRVLRYERTSSTSTAVHTPHCNE